MCVAMRFNAQIEKLHKNRWMGNPTTECQCLITVHEATPPAAVVICPQLHF